MRSIEERIIRRVNRNSTAVGLLVFLSKHPDNWFDEHTIQVSIDALNQPLTRLLHELVDDGFLACRLLDGDKRVYALTKHPEVRNAVFHLAGHLSPGY